MFPLAGGDYQFLKVAYGRWAGFLLGWVLFWVINPGSIAALAIDLVSYLALFVLRWCRPELDRPYRTWGYPLVPLLFGGAYLWIALQIGWVNPCTSLLGVLIALTGMPFYLWLRRKVRAKTPLVDYLDA